jgi:hypothetical protein
VSGESGGFKGVKDRADYIKGYKKAIQEPGRSGYYAFPSEVLTPNQVTDIYETPSSRRDGDIVVDAVKYPVYEDKFLRDSCLA